MTNYITRRLIERERALAECRAVSRDEERRVVTNAPAELAAPLALLSERRQRRFLVRLFVFLVDLFGVAMLFALLAAAA